MILLQTLLLWRIILGTIDKSMENNLLDDLGYLDKEKQKLVYVGFFKRLGAAAVDNFAILIIVFVFFVVAKLIDNLIFTEFSDIAEEFIVGLVFLLYYPILESSKLQGSLGKHLIGIKVVDKEGNRISFLRALMRFFLKFWSFIIAFLGFVSIAFTEKKQGLHDAITETYVVEK